MASWSQTQKGGRSDEKAHQKKEDEKSQVETWSQTQTVGEADEKLNGRKRPKSRRWRSGVRHKRLEWLMK